MSSASDRLAEAAQAAVAAGDWASTRNAFEAAVAREPTAEVLAGLGDVSWWLAETERAIRYQERAYAAFRRRGDPANSAMTAVGQYLIYRVSLGHAAAARGWLARAGRLVTEAGLAALERWVALLRAHDSADPVTAGRLSTSARTLSTRFGDIDLELCALSQLGAALVQESETGRAPFCSTRQ